MVGVNLTLCGRNFLRGQKPSRNLAAGCSQLHYKVLLQGEIRSRSVYISPRQRDKSPRCEALELYSTQLCNVRNSEECNRNFVTSVATDG